MRRTQLRHALLLAAIGAAYAGSAAAGGFQLQNQTGSGNGNAFAGAAATAEDAGTIFFNPAGMTMLPEGHSFSLAGTIQERTIKFEDTGTTNTALTPGVTTPNGKNAGGTAFIPAFYWAYSIDSSTRIGLGVSPTFGNKTDYGFNFIGRNAGYSADIKQYNINPSVALKLSDDVSVGFGVSYAINDSEFKSGAAAQSKSVTIKGDDSAYGFNGGITVRLNPETKLALTYRSELKFNLDGTRTVDAGTVGVSNGFITAKLTTPAQSSLALSTKLNDQIEVLADLTWTGWSVIKSLDIVDKATSSVSSISYNFRDTMRFGLGANYQYNDAWKLRFGTAYDQGVVKTPPDRTMTLPDSDRIWLAFGAKYKVDESSSIDVGYAHVFFADATTARLVTTAAGNQTVNGKWTGNSVDMVSVQWNYYYR